MTLNTSNMRSRGKVVSQRFDDSDHGQKDSDEGDDDSHGSVAGLTDYEEDEEEVGSLSSSPVKQAHLTPHRPSRSRKLPARYETDEPSTIIPVRRSTATHNQRVTVEVRQGMYEAKTKGTFVDSKLAEIGKRSGSTGKWTATIVTSDSGSGEGDEEAAKGAQKEPQTPLGSRKTRTRQSMPESSTPSRRKKRSAHSANGDDADSVRPSSCTSMPATGSRTVTSASKSKAADEGRDSTFDTSKSHPRPIKRPKLHSAPSPATPKRKTSTGSLGAASPSTAAVFEPTKPFLQPTSADYYFAAHAARRRSAMSKSDSWSASKSRIDRRAELPALTPKEVARLSNPAPDDPLSSTTIGSLALQHYQRQYPSWSSLLFMGNDLIFYGLGAKEGILEDFASTKAAEGEAAVVIIRGRMGFRTEEWVESIEEALDLGSAPASRGGLDERLRRIAASLEDDADKQSRAAPRLILVLHSLDSPSFLTPRARSHLASLSTFTRRVHLICSVTHPNGSLLSRYTGREALWIDCTTLLPMLDDCLLSASGTRLGGLPRAFDLRAGGGMGGLTGMGSRKGQGHAGTTGAGAGGAESQTMTSAAEHAAAGGGIAGGSQHLLSATAALHVLKSVTIKARALFLRLASEVTSQMAATTEVDTVATSSSSPSLSLATRSIPYTRLSILASRNFIATTEVALRALLVEFTTHGLIRLTRGDEAVGMGGGSGNTEERVSIGMATLVELDEVVKGVKNLP